MITCIEKPNPIAEIFKDYQGENPGAAVGIIEKGKIIYQQSFGMAEVETKRPVRSNTNFRLASVSKQFTATAILLLEEEGLIDLNWTLDQVFDNFPKYGKGIQIHHLLNHTSGIWDYEDFVPDTALVNPVRDQGVLEIIQKIDQTYFPAGEEFRYSNTAYALLALMVEKYSGQEFPYFLEENIFKPLGMNHTLAHVKNINSVSERAFGYDRKNRQWVKKDQSSTSAVLGDGGIYSNTEDLFLWDQALHEGKILHLEILERSFSKGKLNNGKEFDYGIGWHIKESEGEKVVYHTGSSTSFRNIFYRIPSRNLSIIILTNRNEPEEASMVDLAEKVFIQYQEMKD
jgi:CubicO group peptidase (beta-lactamase class C family)